MENTWKNSVLAVSYLPKLVERISSCTHSVWFSFQFFAFLAGPETFFSIVRIREIAWRGMIFEAVNGAGFFVQQSSMFQNLASSRVYTWIATARQGLENYDICSFFLWVYDIMLLLEDHWWFGSQLQSLSFSGFWSNATSNSSHKPVALVSIKNQDLNGLLKTLLVAQWDVKCEHDLKT